MKTQLSHWLKRKLSIICTCKCTKQLGIYFELFVRMYDKLGLEMCEPHYLGKMINSRDLWATEWIQCQTKLQRALKTTAGYRVNSRPLWATWWIQGHVGCTVKARSAWSPYRDPVPKYTNKKSAGAVEWQSTFLVYIQAWVHSPAPLKKEPWHT